MARRSPIGRRHPAPQVTHADQMLSIGDAASILADKLCGDPRDWRRYRDARQKLIRRHVESGTLPSTGRGRLLRIEAHAFALWAFGHVKELRDKPGVERVDCLGFPFPIVNRGTFSATFRLSGHFVATQSPESFDQCKLMLRQARAEIAELKNQLAAREDELAKARPLAERAEENRATNRRNASAPRPRK